MVQRLIRRLTRISYARSNAAIKHDVTPLG